MTDIGTEMKSNEDTSAQSHLLIAVDGPSGAGKSSVCKAVARQLKAVYVDTGAMYRAATLAVLRAGVDPTDNARVAEVTTDLPIHFVRNAEEKDQNTSTTSCGCSSSLKQESSTTKEASVVKETQVFLGEEDISELIRGAEVTNNVSAVSANPEVRRGLVAQQQRIAREVGRAVLDGRDIGTVVLPDADLKIFLTASPEVRAKRRFEQDLAAGRTVDFDEVLKSVIRRDNLDSSRAVSPLKPADDAILVDTSTMTINEVIERLVTLAHQREAS